MRESLQQTLKPIKEKTGLWWARFWRWPGLLCECHDELKQLNADLADVRESLRSEQAHGETLERLSTESREIAAASMQRASAEKSLSDNLSEELGNAKVQLQKASETIGGLETRIARGELETERIKAELSKTQADLARSQFEQAREKDEHAQTRHLVRLLRQFIHTRDHVDIPAHPGTVKNILDGMKRLLVVFALLPLCLNAQFPPPILRGPYTTNTVAWANTNVISLSTTNATSKPLTNHYRDGVLTLFGLEAGANITLTLNPSNIVITGAAGGGDAGGTNARQFGTLTLTNLSGTGAVTNVVSLSTTNATSKPITNHFENGILTLYGLEAGANITLSVNESNIVITGSAGGGGLTTNANQFLGVPLSIIDGVSLTNVALFGVTTNMEALQQPSADFTTDLGTASMSYLNVYTAVLQIRDGLGGAGLITIGAPVLGGNYVLFLPNAQGASGQVITNNGVGDLGWWTPGSPQGSNPNQFITNSTIVSIRAGALLTNVFIHQSNNTSVSLVVTNNPGSTRNILEVYNTNRNGFLVLSNGMMQIRGNSSGDSPVLFIENIGANQTYTIWTNGNGGSGSFIMRTDNAGNAVFSPGQTAGETYFGGPDSGSGIVNFNLVTVGSMWRMVPSAAVAAWHGSTLRRGQITNVWDVFVRSNVNWTEVGGSDRVFLQSTSGMSSYTMFLPITNGLAGQVLYNVGGGALSWKDDATGGGGALFNPEQFLPSSTHTNIKSGAFMTNMNFWSTGTNHGLLYQDQDVLALSTKTWNVGSADNAFAGMFSSTHSFVEAAAGTDAVLIRAPNAIAASYILDLPDAQGGNGQVITNDGVGALGWWTPGGPMGFNQNQFASNGNIVSIKSGALLTNTLLYPSNLTGPATIHLSTTAQVTNTAEWRSTNDTISISISSNANAIVYGRLDMSNAVAFRTNNIDFRLPVYQAFTNALQTNLVLQLTNTYEGVTHRIDAYGAGRLGNGRTNAWQLFCTVASGTTIYWPPGTTNGNFDVLVNSNQVVSLTFSGGLGSTNIIAEYRIREGIGAN